jgi:type I restriction enzyme, S subunit
LSLRSSLLSSRGRSTTSVRRALEKLNRDAVAGAGVITAYRDGRVTLRSNRREAGYTFSDAEAGYQGIETGDVVFHALDGFAGAVGVSDSRGNGSPVYHVCRPRPGVDAHFVAELLRFLGVSGFLAQQAPNVRERSIDFRNWRTFARVPLALPDVATQREVVATLAAHDQLTSSLIARVERFIELAKERRAALITAAVTGQLDVRAA